MGVESSSYKLTIMVSPDKAETIDREYLIFRLRKDVPHAKDYINEEGKPTNNGGYWEKLDEDFKPFSKLHPDILFRIDERYDYDGTAETRYFIQDGKSVNIEPVMTWPEFSPEMLK